jgi:VWFA-related protein
MRNRAWTCVALVAGLPLLVCAQGTKSAEAPAPEPSKDASAAPAGIPMRLDVVVTDQSGRPVSGLSAEDFAVFDNGRSGKILAFHANVGEATAESPVRIILLIDTMNASISDVTYERRQVEKFLRQNGGRLAVPVSVDWVTEQGVQAQVAPALDGNAIADKLANMEAHVHSIVASQGVYGAEDQFQRSIQFLDALAQSEMKKPGHKLAIWIGPGWPMLTGPTLDLPPKGHENLFNNIMTMSDRLEKARLSLYSVSLGQADRSTFMYTEWLKGVTKVNETSGANLSQKVLAVQSGGLAEPPSNDIVAAIDECAKDASAFYTLIFEAAAMGRPGEYHELKVQIDKRGLKARAKTGYYVQPIPQIAP